MGIGERLHQHDNARNAVTEKKPTLVTIRLDPQGKGEFKRLGGSQFDEWNNRLADLVASALGQGSQPGFPEAATAAAYAMIDISPGDPIEAMLASQLIVANEASLSLYRRAWAQHADYFEARAKYLQLADKAARTVAMLSERLDAHRNRGQQQIVVKHVTVNADQALVANTVTTGRPAPAATSATALLKASVEKPLTTLDGLDQVLQRDLQGVGVHTK
jgi:hypothetical protein